MTIANRITLTRLALGISIFFLIIQENFYLNFLAIVVLIVATISDYVDGKIAKSTNTTTKFGAIADPFADKVLVMACFLAFASVRSLNIPLWAIFLIVIRELTVSTLRVLAALQNYVLKAEAAGKFKTLIQFVSIYLILIILTIKSVPRNCFALKTIVIKMTILPYYLSAFTAVVTIISGAIYIYNHYKILKTSWGEKKQS